jgi:hypothetical protein
VRKKVALVLAALQATDLAVTQVSPAYGDDHLDHLGVPSWLRPSLPVIKAGAVCALVVTADHELAQSVVGAALVAYYAAAATFHVLSGDRSSEVAPAVVCACLAAAVVRGGVTAGKCR